MLGTFLTHIAYGLWFLAGLLAPRLSRREERQGSTRLQEH
jgi:hypothetical protein